jgi:hypothetical protein
MPAHNERFGATAAGSANLKGSAEMPPLRQAATTLAAISGDSAVGNGQRTKLIGDLKKIKKIARK